MTLKYSRPSLYAESVFVNQQGKTVNSKENIKKTSLKQGSCYSGDQISQERNIREYRGKPVHLDHNVSLKYSTIGRLNSQNSIGQRKIVIRYS